MMKRTTMAQFLAPADPVWTEEQRAVIQWYAETHADKGQVGDDDIAAYALTHRIGIRRVTDVIETEGFARAVMQEAANHAMLAMPRLIQALCGMVLVGGKEAPAAMGKIMQLIAAAPVPRVAEEDGSEGELSDEQLVAAMGKLKKVMGGKS